MEKNDCDARSKTAVHSRPALHESLIDKEEGQKFERVDRADGPLKIPQAASGCLGLMAGDK